ncbi:MAG: FAD-dependent oxidoreductase [Bacteriovoracaceae bacterium]|nr:FAD-dependent oxidoreductase [Bacteriovoracaceae bacterium]
MSDRMNPLSLEHLLKLTLNEYEQKGSIFGVSKHSFFIPSNHPELRMKRYGQQLDTPFGVAAGPQTQLSQNIIASWLTGSRYIELKTIQTLDELEVSKPCIDMEDQGYNCEWSQELKLNESFKEYLNAWIVIHILKHKLGLENDSKDLGCIFNMSCGYNLEGILEENVQTFLKKMRNCENDLKEALDIVRPIYPEVDKLEIPAQITDNITLSTMHGCPPDEIEKIAMYLLEEQGLHTAVKLNPTLNGAEDLREILNDKLGYHDVIIPDLAFGHDLKYPDGIKLLANLQKRAKELGLEFGIKLTNTLESENHKDNFDKVNEMMYMSGRPLHALAINLANKLQKEFNGELDITFSSGADAFNVMHVLGCDIKPITVSTDLLKPGGYERTVQYATNTSAHMKMLGASNLDELVYKTAGKKCGEGFFSKLFGCGTPRQEVRLKNISNYLPKILNDKRYHKNAYPWNLVKTERELGKFDCIQAPCNDTCPTHQDIPSYMHLVGEGRTAEALEVIRQTNPFPNSTGVACDHACEDKCSRLNYDDTVQIRDIKRYAAMKEQEVETILPKRSLEKKVAIIGGGPAGLSAAFYLAYEGFKVEVFEAKNLLGGMLTHALPNFRTSKGVVEKDIQRIKSLGVTIHENTPVDATKFSELKEAFDYHFVAIGAQKSKTLGIDGEDAENVVGHLQFLESVKLSKLTSLPKRVVVIGGGNSAIDCVRTAKRLVPEGGEAILLYRRTVAQMPANREEIEELLDENIKVMELSAPNKVAVTDGKVSGLECYKMELGSPDESGRRRPQKIEGSEFTLDVDFIVKAIGQDINTDFIKEIVPITNWGTVDSPSVFVKDNILTGGDVFRGPSSIIQGVADGKNAAFEIMSKEGVEVPTFTKILKGLSVNDIKKKRSERIYGKHLPKTSESCRNDFTQVIQTFTDEQAAIEASRCLMCDELCDVCTTVCPNRANIGYEIDTVDYTIADVIVASGNTSEGISARYAIDQERQTLNIGDFCNECGNCRAFCPSSGRPYMDKPKLYITEESFAPEADNAYKYSLVDGKHIIEYKNAGHTYKLVDFGENYTLESSIADMKIEKANFKTSEHVAKADGTVDMKEIVGMSVILKSIVKNNFLYNI